MYCEHCGQLIPDYSRFCEQCGKPVSFHPGQNYQKTATSPQPAQIIPILSSKTNKPGSSPDYSRIVFWIQGRFGSRFVPGMDANEARMQLEAIITNEQVRGIPPKTLKGLRSFINKQNYGVLIQPRR